MPRSWPPGRPRPLGPHEAWFAPGALAEHALGLSFQQGLLQAASRVAAQDVGKPFAVLKMCGSRGVVAAPGKALRIPRLPPEKAARAIARAQMERTWAVFGAIVVLIYI